MILVIIKRKLTSPISCFFLAVFGFQIFSPGVAFALTSGPTQPEMQSFEPVGTTDMVDLFSGDFNYNIPLMDVEGYPVNISYHAGVTMEQEATWVGLGWNINPGEVNHMVRGLSDDYSGDVVEKYLDIEAEKNKKFGLFLGAEIAGIVPGSSQLDFGLNFSNYSGVSASIGKSNSLQIPYINVGLNLSATANSQSGADFNYSLSYTASSSKTAKNSIAGTASIGGGLNSREGVQYTTFGVSAHGNHRSSEGKPTSSHSSGVSNTVVPIGLQNYVPVVTNESKMESFFAQLKVGGEIYGVYPFGGGSYAEHSVSYESDGNRRAYGYFNLAKASAADIVDFTRDKDGLINKGTQYLPPASLTYDVYNINGQGTGGSFRPFRNDIGTVYDPLTGTEGFDNSHLVELGFGNTFEAGYDLKLAYTQSSSGPWKDYFRRFDTLTVGSLAEPYYFKQAGELTEGNTTLLTSGSTLQSGDLLVHENVDFLLKRSTPLVTNDRGSKRVARANLLTFLTAEEASMDQMSLMPKIEDHNGLSVSTVKRHDPSNPDDPRKAHQVSEFTQVLPDGRRYIYGLPVMNKYQVDYEYSVPYQPNNPTTVDLVGAPSAYDGSSTSDLVQRYYSKTKTPAYATAYLITAILSPDYSDLTGDGLSEDDLGSYTKFNYTRKETDYLWRTPYLETKAQYNPGIRSNCKDDKANFSGGSREVWMLHSIETKNYIAFFQTSARLDGKGSEDFTNLAPQCTTAAKSYKLDRIELYNKAEWQSMGSAAIPVKTVVFSYDYSLCQGIPNSSLANSGKLTLRSISIGYGASDIGYLSPYRFNYGGPAGSADNPNYDLNAKDMWGSYKPANSNSDPSKNLGLGFNNLEYPYPNQNDPSLDVYAGAWNLTQILLPSGGSINIQYESDDYAYVQDKYAMEMFKVEGAGPTKKFSPGNALYGSLQDPYLYVYFRRKSQENSSTVGSSYLNGENVIQYNFEVELSSGRTSLCTNTPLTEMIKGYATVLESGVCDDPNYGYLKLDPKTPNTLADLSGIGVSRLKVNPITVAAINFARYYNPTALRPESQSGDFDQNTIKSLVSSIGEFKNFFQNPMRSYLNKNKAKFFTPDRSYIRLVSQNRHTKKGGGHRVKSLVFYDTWEGSSSVASYGYNYNYTTQDEATGQSISSGVASYEPLIAGNENPCRTLLNTQQSGNNSKFPPVDPIELIQEGPIGESLFPPANVGYSKVTVSSIHKADGASAQAENVSEFYTAKDFPVRSSSKEKETLEDRTPKFWDIFEKKDIYEVAQGHAIYLNDMHGKLKQQSTWLSKPGSGAKELATYTKYEYFRNDGTGNSTLNNSVPCLEFSGTQAQPVLHDRTIGEEIDFTVDSRRKKQETNFQTYMFSLNMFLAPPIPIGIPLVFPQFRKQTNQFSSVVNTKVIQRYGILKSVENFDKGALVKVENVAFDAKTGQVLITKVNTEYNDFQYTVKYPAYWAYRCMGGAYENIMYEEEYERDPSNGNQTQAIIHDYKLYLPVADLDLFNLGDELELDLENYCTNQNSLTDLEKFKVWVIKKGNFAPGLPNAMCQTSANSTICTDNPPSHLSYHVTQVQGPPPPPPLPPPCLDKATVEQTILNLFDGYSGLNTQNLGEYEQVSLTYNIPPWADPTVGNYQIAGTPYYWAPLHGKSDQTNFVYDAKTFLGYSGFIYNSPVFYTSGYLIDEIIQIDTDPDPNVENWTQHADGRFGSLTIRSAWDQTTSAVPAVLINPNTGKYYNSGEIIRERVFYGPTWHNGVYYRKIYRVISNGVTDTGRLRPYLVCIPDRKDASAVNALSAYQWPQYAKVDKAHVKVIRSGKRNQLTETVQEITGLGDPIGAGSALKAGNFSEVIQSTARAFTHEASVPAALANPANTVHYNDYVNGRRGNYRPWYTAVMHAKRDYASGHTKDAGLYNLFIPFWSFQPLPSAPLLYDDYSPFRMFSGLGSEWTKSDEVVAYSPYGNDLEVVNAAGVRNSVLTGYGHKLPVAAVQNCSWNRALYENFEDYGTLVQGPLMQSHIQFHQNGFREYLKNLLPANLNGTVFEIAQHAHTGKYGLHVKSSATCTLPVSPSLLNTTSILYPFYLLSGKKYVISCWQYVGAGPVPQVSIVQLNGVAGLLRPKTPIIDGWALFECETVVPGTASSVSLSFTGAGYIDDLRILPVEANMKGYVYDAYRQRLMAILDENNMSTRFEYSAEGKLQRVKKETEKGVLTLKESRESLKKGWTPPNAP